MNIHIHHHHHYDLPLVELLPEILKAVKINHQKLLQMSDVNNKVLAAEQAVVDILGKLRTDVQALAGNINPAGLNADEAQAVIDKLNSIGSALTDIDVIATPAPAAAAVPVAAVEGSANGTADNTGSN